MRIYFPMTASIITPGHIKCLDYLSNRGDVIIGLLSAKALKGYKEEIVSYQDRLYVLGQIACTRADRIVRQNDLNPRKNVLKYKCDAIASGDGWEQKELEAIRDLKLKKIDIKLRGEKTKKYSSTKIWKRKNKKSA